MSFRVCRGMGHQRENPDHLPQASTHPNRSWLSWALRSSPGSWSPPRRIRGEELDVRIEVAEWSDAAGGTVRWGLRTGQIAWPNRSAPASAVGKLAFNNGVGDSSSGVGSFDVALLPRLRRLGHSGRILLGLLLRMDGFGMGGIAALPGRRDRLGLANFGRGWDSRTDFHHRGHGTPPRASRVEPGQHRGSVPDLMGSATIPSPLLPAAGRRSLPAARPADLAGRPERWVPSSSSTLRTAKSRMAVVRMTGPLSNC